MKPNFFLICVAVFGATFGYGVIISDEVEDIQNRYREPPVSQSLEFEPYVYQAEVVSVYDADTVTLDVDLGFNITTEQKFRLYGIDAWEMRGDERSKGTIARDWLRGQIPDGSTVYIKTEKDKQGKYGRYLATIHKDIGEGSLNVKLVELGHAVFKEY